MMLALTTFAQKDVTKFLGIPVDGTKAQMIAKLKAKGFTPSTKPYKKGALTGTFNGRKVDLYIVTNNNKVYRIMVADQQSDNATDIKIHFNNLCEQFKNNKKYISFEDQTIPKEENILHEMIVNNKRYQACFYQAPSDTAHIKNVAMAVREKLLQKYSEYQLANPTEEIQKEATSETMSAVLEDSQNRSVWFMITENFSNFQLVMYYDNEYNKANGEDL